MSRTTIAFTSLLALLVLGAVGFALSSGTGSDPAAPAAAFETTEGEHSVVLTADGFEPEELTIKQGETVVFSTTRDTHFWPASNLHPTHRIYAAFDPKRPIPPAETWSFTFEELGTWRMHDHLAPYFTGTILVEE